MRVAGDHSHYRNLDAGGFDEPVQCRRKRVSKDLLKSSDSFDRWLDRTNLVSEAFPKKQQPSGSKIGLCFDPLLAVLGQHVCVVSERHIVVPGNDAVTDFVRLVPAVLEFGERRIQKNPLAIRKVERLERRLPDCFHEQHRSFVNLDARNADPVDRLMYDAGIIGGVKHEIKP